MKIKFLGAHNTESQSSRLSGLLIDDILALDAGGLTSSLTLSQQLKIRALLVTHQHYDHIRDIPLIAMNFFLSGDAIDIYSIAAVRDALSAHLLNGSLYPKFLEKPEGNATIRFHELELYKEVPVEGYSVLPLPVKHSVPAAGYQITAADGKKVFYTGDAGPGLADCWQYISPQLLIVEVTVPDRFEEYGRESLHFTPGLLKQELIEFKKAKGYLPEVISVHMNPGLEPEITAELARVAGELGNPITPAYEGRQLSL